MKKTLIEMIVGVILSAFIGYSGWSFNQLLNLRASKLDRSSYEKSLNEQKEFRKFVNSQLLSINEKKLDKSNYQDQKKDIQVLKDQNQKLINSIVRIETSLELLLEGYKKNRN